MLNLFTVENVVIYCLVCLALIFASGRNNYSTMWVNPFLNPLVAVVESGCVKIGITKMLSIKCPPQ